MSAFRGKAYIDYVDGRDANACKRLDTSTQGEYTKSKPAPENVRDFNGSAIANPATPTISFTNQFKRLVNFLNLRKNVKKGSPMWHQRWGNIAQMVSAVAALCAVVGVIVQLYLIRGNAKEASARQVYMSYSEATLKYPQAFTTKPGEDQIRSG